jgi:hypothetical protein
MNSKKSKLRTNQNLSLKTPALSSRNHRARSNSSGKNVDNTALYFVSRSLSTKRLNLLIKESKRTLESLQKSEEQLQLFNQQLFFISQSTCSVIDNDLFSSLEKVWLRFLEFAMSSSEKLPEPQVNKLKPWPSGMEVKPQKTLFMT